MVEQGVGTMRDEREAVERYGRTGERAEQLAAQCARRLLRGDSPNVVESSLLARGVYPVDRIMELAYRLVLGSK